MFRKTFTLGNLFVEFQVSSDGFWQLTEKNGARHIYGFHVGTVLSSNNIKAYELVVGGYHLMIASLNQ